MRTPEEIVERIRRVETDDDFFGFEREVLLSLLDFEHAKPFLKEGATSDKWPEPEFRTETTVKKSALEYLEFAWGKAEYHRGLSASRSIEKMTSFCWLLGIDLAPIDAAGYAQYGCPKLKVISQLLGAPMPDSEPMLRMMAGKPCRPDCEEGCGR